MMAIKSQTVLNVTMMAKFAIYLSFLGETIDLQGEVKRKAMVRN